MNRLTLFSCLLALGVAFHPAGQAEAQFVFGAATVQTSRPFYRAPGSELFEREMRYGYRFGLGFEVPFSERVAIRGEWFYSRRGYRYGQLIGGETDPARLTREMSVNYAGFDASLRVYLTQSRVRAFVQGGAYYAMALSGNVKTSIEYPLVEFPVEREGEVDFGRGAGDDLRRSDVGLTAGLGARINQIELVLSYRHGEFNMVPGFLNEPILLNRQIALSVVWCFGEM